VAKNRRYLAVADFNELYDLAKVTKALIGGFMRYLKECLKGSKPRRG